MLPGAEVAPTDHSGGHRRDASEVGARSARAHDHDERTGGLPFLATLHTVAWYYGWGEREVLTRSNAELAELAQHISRELELQQRERKAQLDYLAGKIAEVIARMMG